MKINTALGLLAGKSSHFVLSKMGRGSTLPGKVALTFDKNILQTKKIGNKYIYKAIYSENDCLETLTKNFVGKFCNKKLWNKELYFIFW